MLISAKMNAALNEQVGNEFGASMQYVQIATYFEGEGLPMLARHFYKQAEEEREHAMKMVNYLLDRNAKVDFTEVSKPRTAFADHVEPIKLALEQEQQVTVHIADLFQIARETNDYLGEQFLHWFLEEQVEEESSMQDLLTVAERTRQIPMLLEEYLARETPGDKAAD